MSEIEIKDRYKKLIYTVDNKEDLIDMLQVLFVEDNKISEQNEELSRSELDNLFEDWNYENIYVNA